MGQAVGNLKSIHEKVVPILSAVDCSCKVLMLPLTAYRAAIALPDVVPSM